MILRIVGAVVVMLVAVVAVVAVAAVDLTGTVDGMTVEMVAVEIAEMIEETTTITEIGNFEITETMQIRADVRIQNIFI